MFRLLFFYVSNLVEVHHSYANSLFWFECKMLAVYTGLQLNRKTPPQRMRKRRMKKRRMRGKNRRKCVKMLKMLKMVLLAKKSEEVHDFYVKFLAFSDHIYRYLMYYVTI